MSDAAEKSLVGCALLDPGVVHAVKIPPDYFTHPGRRAIWVAINSLLEQGKPVDEITVSDEMEGDDLSFVVEHTLAVPTSDNSQHYADIVREAYLGRQAKLIAGAALKSAKPASELVYDLIEQLEALQAEDTHGATDLAKGTADEIESIREHVRLDKPPILGLQTGMGLETICPTGIPTDKVTLIFGETGHGKTTCADNLADAIASSGHVLRFSLEDSIELTRQSRLARVSGVPYSRIVTRDLEEADIKKLEVAAKQTEAINGRIHVVGEVPPTMDEIIRTARQYARRHDLKAVFVDYIQLLEYGRSEERTALGEAVKKASAAAKRDKVAYVLVSQVNREKMVRRNSFVPQLEDLFGSSVIKQCCKLALGYYRPVKYSPTPKSKFMQQIVTERPDGEEIYQGYIELWVRKNRLGAVDVFKRLYCDLPTGRITTLEERLKNG